MKDLVRLVHCDHVLTHTITTRNDNTDKAFEEWEKSMGNVWIYELQHSYQMLIVGIEQFIIYNLFIVYKSNQ